MMKDTILEKYQIRKSNKEKEEFIDYIKNRLSKSGYDVQKEISVESKGKGIFKNQNIVVGNPEEAEILITAHYDTCAVLPFPNLMSPTSPVLFLLFQILLAFLILCICGVISGLILFATNNFVIAYYGLIITLFTLLGQMLIGYRNKHTANDNTSGVITITKIMEELPEEYRKKVCAVYFDNEEKGLIGSSYFATRHKKVKNNKWLINFDCVGDGENVVTMAKKKVRMDARYSLFTEIFQQQEERFEVKYHGRKMFPMMFPSDQVYFKKSIGVCTLKKSPLGMYAARIHTPMDTKCREENIAYLCNAMQEFIQKQINFCGRKE